MNNEEFLIEKKNLEKTIEEYKEVISDTKLKIKNLPNLYPDKEHRMIEQERLTHKVEKLDKGLKKTIFCSN